MEEAAGLLESEFSALEMDGQQKRFGKGGCCWRLRLTEITLSSDVFPAFCKPIMVTSISVALFVVSDM